MTIAARRELAHHIDAPLGRQSDACRGGGQSRRDAVPGGAVVVQIFIQPRRYPNGSTTKGRAVGKGGTDAPGICSRSFRCTTPCAPGGAFYNHNRSLPERAAWPC